MSFDTILIGNANTFMLTDFRDALSGALESYVEAYASLCERPPKTGDRWLVHGASNASPIVITSSEHGLVTGDTVTIVNVGDNRGAHGTFAVTVIDDDQFSLNGSAGTADWTDGGAFFRCIPDCEGLPYALTGNGQYQVTIEGNVGLVAGVQYTFVNYCLGAFRDLFNEIDKVTAKVRGNA